MTEVDPRIQVRLDEDTAAWLADRTERMLTGSHHKQARQELGLWQGALRAELRRLRLTLNQANCIADVHNSVLLDASLAVGAPLLYFGMVDAFQIAHGTPIPTLSSYGTKWGIDETALLDYLSTLGPTADHALLDAVSRWWDTKQEPTVEGWRAVGLTVIDDQPAREGR